MENLQRIVMLIDADNTQIGKLEDVIGEIFGNIDAWKNSGEESLWQLAQRHT